MEISRKDLISRRCLESSKSFYFPSFPAAWIAEGLDFASVFGVLEK